MCVYYMEDIYPLLMCEHTSKMNVVIKGLWVEIESSSALIICWLTTNSIRLISFLYIPHKYACSSQKKYRFFY